MLASSATWWINLISLQQLCVLRRLGAYTLKKSDAWRVGICSVFLLLVFKRLTHMFIDRCSTNLHLTLKMFKIIIKLMHTVYTVVMWEIPPAMFDWRRKSILHIPESDLVVSYPIVYWVQQTFVLCIYRLTSDTLA